MPRLAAIVPATNDPGTLGRCLAAIAAAAEPPDEVIVVDDPPHSGPAAARNAGARRATADLLAFVDSDVEVHRDVFARMRARFAADRGLTGLFGTYDDRPAARGAVSGFRNLLHHHIHIGAAGPAQTFWAGLGAIRREAFLDHDGFDQKRYPGSSIEDIELGGRIVRSGGRIELDPAIQGTHLKPWTLRTMVESDLLHRGIPWVRLLLSTSGERSMLSLGWRHRISAVAAVLGALAVVTGRGRHVAGALVGLVALNHRFYALLLRRRGRREAALGVGLHALHHLTAVAALVIGAMRHLLERLEGRARADQPARARDHPRDGFTHRFARRPRGEEARRRTLVTRR